MSNVLKYDSPQDTWIEVPSGYKSNRHWAPQIGDIFPNISAETTNGLIQFHNWAEGRWVYFFSLPAPFTPICTTELASLAEMADDFEESRIAILGLSVGQVDDINIWVEEIQAMFGVTIEFPIVADPEGVLAKQMSLIHPKEDDHMTIRKSFVLDPAMRVRIMFDYPGMIGRSSEEVLRSANALQATDFTGLAVPADWKPGDCLLARPFDNNDAELRRRFGNQWTKLSSYLKVIEAKSAYG